jgi:hypothetical protein
MSRRHVSRCRPDTTPINPLGRLGRENVFDRDFLAEVDLGVPLALLGETYTATQARSLINRMVALDLKFTLADNDLPKVTRTCDIAGVDVAFPLLHESVVDLSTTLPASFKVRGGQLRYFFKRRCATACRKRPSRRKSTASAYPPACGCATIPRCASSVATRC